MKGINIPSTSDCSDNQETEYFGETISQLDDLISSKHRSRRLCSSLMNSMIYVKGGILTMIKSVQGSHRQKSLAAFIQIVIQIVVEASAPRKQCANVDLLALDFNLKHGVVPQEWTYAIKSFMKSRKEATIVFYTTELRSKDKIMACKLCIVSTILGKMFDEPKAAYLECLHYLQDLHDFKAVRRMFTVYVNGGIKSFLTLKISKRIKIVKSITATNQILSDLMVTYRPRIVLSVSSEWPVIKMTDDSKKSQQYIIVDGEKMKEKVTVTENFSDGSRSSSCFSEQPDCPNLREDYSDTSVSDTELNDTLEMRHDKGNPYGFDLQDNKYPPEELRENIAKNLRSEEYQNAIQILKSSWNM